MICWDQSTAFPLRRKVAFLISSMATHILLYKENYIDVTPSKGTRSFLSLSLSLNNTRIHKNIYISWFLLKDQFPLTQKEQLRLIQRLDKLGSALSGAVDHYVKDLAGNFMYQAPSTESSWEYVKLAQMVQLIICHSLLILQLQGQLRF